MNAAEPRTPNPERQSHREYMNNHLETAILFRRLNPLRAILPGKIILIDTRDAWPEPSYLQPAGKTLRRLGGCGAQTVAVGFAA
jgi:hypothetical protein